MRKTIIFLVFFCFIQYAINVNLNCSDISNIEGYTNCTLYEGGFPGFSCYNSINNVNPLLSKRFCTIFPNDEDMQKQYVNYMRGFNLEKASVSFNPTENYDDDEEDEAFDSLFYAIIIPEEETYEKGETIIFKNFDLTESDKEVIKGKNNCYYHFYGKLLELKNSEGKSANVSSLNILDKNICFDADIFEDNEDLVNCGFGHFNIILNGKIYNLTTCFFVPEQISNDLLFLYSNSYKTLLDDFVNDFAELNDDGVLNLKNKVRKLPGNVEYEFIVEDKNGKKVKYSYDNSMVQIINYDEETDGTTTKVTDKATDDDIDEDTETISPIDPDCFGYYFSKINIFMALSSLCLLLL